MALIVKGFQCTKCGLVLFVDEEIQEKALREAKLGEFVKVKCSQCNRRTDQQVTPIEIGGSPVKKAAKG